MVDPTPEQPHQATNNSGRGGTGQTHGRGGYQNLPDPPPMQLWGGVDPDPNPDPEQPHQHGKLTGARD